MLTTSSVLDASLYAVLVPNFVGLAYLMSHDLMRKLLDLCPQPLILV
jgi:hypothetical protein